MSFLPIPKTLPKTEITSEKNADGLQTIEETDLDAVSGGAAIKLTEFDWSNYVDNASYGTS